MGITTVRSSFHGAFFVYSGLLIAILLILTLQFRNWQEQVASTTPMHEALMQIEVRLNGLHLMLQEYKEGLHVVPAEAVNKEFVDIKQMIANAYDGKIHVGGVIGHKADDAELARHIQQLYDHTSELEAQIRLFEGAAIGSYERGQTHDIVFANMLLSVKEADKRVHQLFQASVERQNMIFKTIAGVIVLLFFFVYMKWNQTKKVLSNLFLKANKLSGAVEQSGELVVIASNDGMIEYVNPVVLEATGFSADELVSHSISMLCDNGKALSKMVLEGMCGVTGKWQGEVTGLCKHGSPYPAISTLSPIKDEYGIVTHFVMTMQDMSDYKAIEAELNQARKLETLGTLVGGIAHEFNNLLGSMTGNVYLINKHRDKPELVKEKAALLESICSHMAEHIKALLVFARKGVPEKSMVSVSEVIHDSMLILRASMPGDIEIHCECQKNLSVLANQSQLVQCMINILTNSFHALEGSKSPEIRVSAQVSASAGQGMQVVDGLSWVKITICDNGAGIPEAVQEKVFEPFFTTKDVGKGTGLGLSTVYGVIKSYGGDVKIDSAPGRGTCVHLWIPGGCADGKQV